MADGGPSRGRLWSGQRPLVVGHRGAPRRAPPNSLQALAAARHLGADAVEIDVRCTGDDHLILHHDATIAGAPVRELTLPQARRRAREQGLQLATLTEAIDTVDGMQLDVELKDPHAGIPALELLTEHRDPRDLLVTSFHTEALTTAARIAPTIRRGLLLSPAQALRLLSRRRRARRIEALAQRARADALIVHRSFARLRLLGPIAAGQRPVLVWTVNHDRELRRHLRHPLVDGVITDRTARAVHLRQAQRGQTPTAAPTESSPRISPA